jgi:hypothetical protein
MQTLDVGEVAQIVTQWWNDDGDAAEPSAITLTITKPDGSTVTVLKAAMTGSASGSVPGTLDVWTALQLVDASGVWRYTPVGIVDGATVTQVEQVFLVGVQSAPTGPCAPWCTWEDVEGCTNSDFSGIDSAQRESIIDTASGILWDLTDRVYSGLCVTTRSLCSACLLCGPSRCGCDPAHGLYLGENVAAAWDVVVDGETLEPTSYTIVGGTTLARTDDLSWPRGIDVTDPTAFRATWAFGRLVPEGGKRAAALFAAEIAKSCVGIACQLPQRVSQVTREGVSYTILDSMQMVADGRTGIALVDLWVVADKQGRRPRPRMFSPGAHGTRRVL